MTDHTIDSEVDQLLIKIIENYTNALNKISVEQSNADDFDKHYKYIQAETARAIQQHYTPNHKIAQEANKAVVGLPQKIDQKCYNCGHPLFAYDGRARCLYCGCHEALTSEKGSNNG